MYKPKYMLCRLLFSGLILVSCHSPKSDDQQQLQTTGQTRNDSIKQIAAQTDSIYHNMSNSGLLQKLAEQSKKQKEPFNSTAYRELRKRKNIGADSIIAVIHEIHDGNALLPLLLLRELYVRQYLEIPDTSRSFILTEALEQSRTFNTWGLPNLYLENASKAMIESGMAAYPALRRVLSETRPAPIWGGGQEGMEAARYKYRVCDYALFFIRKIKGDSTFVLPMDVLERDKLIQETLK
jgi:hypothetical protein